MKTELAKLAIQCTPKGGDTRGSFLFADGDSAPFTPISPVFPDLLGLYEWNKANGWYESAYTPFYKRETK